MWLGTRGGVAMVDLKGKAGVQCCGSADLHILTPGPREFLIALIFRKYILVTEEERR